MTGQRQTGLGTDAELQLERIEQIQQRLHQVIRDETLDQFEELLTELNSRLSTVFGTGGVQLSQLAPHRERIERIGTAQQELAKLAGAALATLTKRLSATHDARQLNNKYKVEPAKLAASLRTSTDLKG
jgi:hypothetical protein